MNAPAQANTLPSSESGGSLGRAMIEHMSQIDSELQKLQARMEQSTSCGQAQKDLVRQMMTMMKTLQAMQSNVGNMNLGQPDSSNPSSGTGTGSNPFLTHPPPSQMSSGMGQNANPFVGQTQPVQQQPPPHRQSVRYVCLI